MGNSPATSTWPASPNLYMVMTRADPSTTFWTSKTREYGSELLTSALVSSLNHHLPFLSTSHISDAGPSNQPRASSKKHKPDDSLDSQQASKKSRQERTCQKCGSQNCAGKASRKYCKRPCQDCEDVDCSGRNSQLKSLVQMNLMNLSCTTSCKYDYCDL